MKCLWHKCGKEFEPAKKGQKFCSGGKCKDAHNNWLKSTGIHLAPRVLAQLQEIADGQGVPIDAMANVMLARVLNPDGKPLEDAEIYGVKQ